MALKKCNSKQIMFILLIASAMAISTGCSTKMPQKHSFDKSKTYNSGYDEVWSAIVSTFAEDNIPIKTIEKDSGIIVSDKMKVPFVTTSKNLFVSDYCDCGGGSIFKFKHAYGEYNVFVRKVDNGKTSVQINSKYQVNIYDPLAKRFFTRECEPKGHLVGKILSRIDTMLNR